MLDYKDIIVKHFGLGMSGRQIVRELGVSKSGVNDVLGAFKRCESLDFPLPEGITNYGIAAKIYGGSPGAVGRDMTYACPDFEEVHKQLHERKNMTLVYPLSCIVEAILWHTIGFTFLASSDSGLLFYRQLCRRHPSRNRIDVAEGMGLPGRRGGSSRLCSGLRRCVYLRSVLLEIDRSL